ncbi:MAG TPA: SRPBCC domain-containing protein [Galbitalea sp.]
MTETEGMTITRTFRAPRELVFDAWTNPVHFARWWGGDTVEVPADSVEMDVRVGGSWKATMVLPEGGHEIHWVGEYLEVDPPERLVLTLSDGSEGDAREVVTVSLTEVAGGTEMVCHQDGGHLTPAQYEEAKKGYELFFDAFAEIVEA